MILQFEPTGTFDEKLLLFALGTFIFIVLGIVLVEISYRARRKRYEKMSDEELVREFNKGKDSVGVKNEE